MDYTGKTLNGYTKHYTLNKPLKDGTGGEGTVYSIKGRPRLVAKIYHEKVLNRPRAEIDTRRRKLECMLKHSIQATYKGKLRVAWPQDILFDGGQMVGYIMPKVKSTHGLYKVWMQDKQDEIFHKYTWRKSVRVARSLAQAVATLHKSNVVLGDFNPKNFLVDCHGNVILVDTDSYDITDPDTGERFPCQVARPEMLAPELQGYRNLSAVRAPFNKDTDRFSLALLLFRLLMGGFHPFGCACVAGAVSSSAGITEQTEIVNGNCAYVREVYGRRISPLSPTLDFLTEDVRDLFVRTFNYTAYTAKSNISNRASAEEWVSVLGKLSRRLFRRCRANHRHVFPNHNKHCPFCGKKRRSRMIPAFMAVFLVAMLMWYQNTGSLNGLVNQATVVVDSFIPKAVSFLNNWTSNVSDFLEDMLPPAEREEPAPETEPTPPTEPECLLPSDQRPLTMADVEGMTRAEVQLAINEIYARHGRYFSDAKFVEYFQSKSWYQPQPGLSDSEILEMLTQIEFDNLQFLVQYRDNLS